MNNVKEIGLEEIRKKIEKARGSFNLWKKFSLEERIGYLNSLKNIIYKERESIAKLLVEDSARVQFSAEGLVFEVLNTFFIAKEAKKILNKQFSINLNRLFYRTKKCYTVYEPVGVVGIISPTNSPFFESFQQIIQAVIMGNTVVVKPSERAPLVSRKIEELVGASRVPEGVINIIHGGPDVGEALVHSQEIDKIILYGTRLTGQKVVEISSLTLKPFVLGLGGSEAAIVLDNCYLSRTVEGLVYGAFCNSGQTCSCIRRVIAFKGIAETLLEKLRERIKKLDIGTLGDIDNEIGVVKKREDAQSLLQAVKEAKQNGANVVVGGQYEENINRISPLLITNVTQEMRIMQEEFMGPYMCFSVVNTIEEAVNLANNTIYGLSASIWASDFRHVESIARRLKVGTVWINDSQFYHYRLPYGGVKQSGFGKTSGKEGLLEYVNKKLICVETSAKNNFYWFPYSREKIGLMRKMLSFKHQPGFIKRVKNFVKIFLKSE